jgi:hypothetical protein
MAANAAVWALGVAAGGTALSYIENKKAAKAQRRAAQQAQRAQELRSARERRQQYRKLRQARAQAVAQQAVSAGGFGSSSFATGLGGMQTQTASNISFLNQYTNIIGQQGMFQSQAATAMGKAQIFGSIAGLGMQTATLFKTS